MSEILTATPIPCYESVEEQRLAGEQKLTGLSPTYLRYGTPIHARVESQIAELTGALPEETLIFNTGMTAVKAAVGAGYSQAKKRTESPKIAFARELYTGTTRWLKEFTGVHGIETKCFSALETTEIERTLDSFRPDIVVVETVANFASAPVLDYDHLLGKTREQENVPLLILDNTLPLSTGCDVYSGLLASDRACVVESGTKAYTFNLDTLGIAYSKNEELVSALRAVRNEGDIPGTGSARYIADLLPTKEEFDDRNTRIFENTGYLALALYEASQDTDIGYIVDHPAVPTHEHYGQTFIENGGFNTPVVFLQPLDNSQSLELAARIGDNHEVDKHIQRSDSFGFDRAAFYSCTDSPYIRLAGGAETDAETLGTAIKVALKS